MGKKIATVAYENPRTKRKSSWEDRLLVHLTLMGAPNAEDLVSSSLTYVDGARRGGIDPKTAAAVIWHHHCSSGGKSTAPCVAGEESGAACPAETAAECPSGNPVAEESRHEFAAVDFHVGSSDVTIRATATTREKLVVVGGTVLPIWWRRGWGKLVRGDRVGTWTEGNTRYVMGGGPEPRSVSEANEASLDKIPACAPFTHVVKDPVAFAACQARAKQIGPLDTDRKMYEFLRSELEKQDQEIFVVIGLDLHMNVRLYDEVARGQRDRVAVNVEDILRVVIANGVHGFIVAHNHPSGAATPSKKDGELTATIRSAAMVACPNIIFCDHLVVGSGQYYTFEDKKLKHA